jgi:hypothetical protein
MATTINTALANDLLDAIDATFNGGTLTIRTGAAPGANNAATGTVLATITLPADAFGAAAGAAKPFSGTWEDAAADATGTAAHFRLVNVGATRVLEGTVTATGGGGDLQVSNVAIQSGNPFQITGFTLTAAGA